MNIGTLAKQAKVNIQTVRYYERLGILKPTARRESGYRVYDGMSLQRLLFIKRAQELGFTLKDVKELLALHLSATTSRERARAKAKERLADIAQKIDYLSKLEATLKKLIRNCERGALTGPCPILEHMAGVR